MCEEEEVWDFEVQYAAKGEVSEDEWDFNEHNINYIWIEELESSEGFEITSYEIIDQDDKEYGEDTLIKFEDEHDEKGSHGLGQGEIKLMTAKPCIQERIVDQTVVTYELDDLTEMKYSQRSDTGREEKSKEQKVQKLGERKNTIKVWSSDDFQEKMEKTSKSGNTRKAKEQLQKNYAEKAKMKIQGQLVQRRPYDQDTHDGYDIGAGIKRPPCEGDQLGIEGEY